MLEINIFQKYITINNITIKNGFLSKIDDKSSFNGEIL